MNKRPQARFGQRIGTVIYLRPEDAADSCDACGAPDGEELPEGGRVLVVRQASTARNHAARGRALCESCAGAFDQETWGEA